MARILIVGCGCRGQALARELRRAGHAVRGTTRDPRRQTEIEAAGAEPHLGDPDRIGTLTPALDGATIMCLLLGSATGSHADLEALHGSRLEMLLQRTIDTTVRGVIYEATGSVDGMVLATGERLLRRKCERNGIPYRILPGQSLAEAVNAVEALLAPT